MRYCAHDCKYEQKAQSNTHLGRHEPWGHGNSIVIISILPPIVLIRLIKLKNIGINKSLKITQTHCFLTF